MRMNPTEEIHCRHVSEMMNTESPDTDMKIKAYTGKLTLYRKNNFYSQRKTTHLTEGMSMAYMQSLVECILLADRGD